MIKDKLQSNLKQAQLVRDEVKVSTLRLLLSEIKNAEIVLRQSSGQAKGGVLTEEDIVSVIQKEIKKRKEAAEGFRKGGREEQALKEEAELKVLQSYLPEMLSNEELTKLIDDTINEIGAKSLDDLGMVMGRVMGKVTGRADGNMVSALVKEKLSS